LSVSMSESRRIAHMLAEEQLQAATVPEKAPRADSSESKPKSNRGGSF